MLPSRRDTIGVVGTSALTLLAGCSTVLGGDTTDTDQPNTGSSGANVSVRLQDSNTMRRLFTESDIVSVGAVQHQQEAYVFSVSLAPDPTANVSRTFRTVGVDSNPDAFEIVVLHNGQEVTRFGISPGLAATIADQEWQGELQMTFQSREEATSLRKTLLTVSTAVGASPTGTNTSTTTDRPPADQALIIKSKLAVEGTMVNVGVEGTATNTAAAALANCVITATGEVGGKTFSGQARRDRLAPSETWEWEVAFGKEADALQDNSVENISIETQAEYAE